MPRSSSTTDTGHDDRLAEILERIAAAPDTLSPQALRALVAEIRPECPDDTARALKNLHALEYLLVSRADLRLGLRAHLIHQLDNREQTDVLAELGILPGTGFFTELARRVADRLLPEAHDERSIQPLLAEVFDRPTDFHWVRGIDASHWERLLATLDLGFNDREPVQGTAREAIEAIQIIAHRIAAIGLEPELARVLPELRAFESPFVAQNTETQGFLAKQLSSPRPDPAGLEADRRHILVLLDQCEAVIARIRRATRRKGVSVSLTYRLQQLGDNLERQRDLLDAVASGPSAIPASVRLLSRLVEAHCTRRALRPHFARNTELLAREITEHSGRTGDHYITATREEYRAMFRSALGAGAIVPFMALLKLWLHDLHAPPLIEALSYCLDYAIGFVLIQVLHFTLATKQPAMTATHLAAALDSSPGRRPDTDGMVELIVRLCRSQFIAIVGNVALALPLAFLIALAWSHGTGTHLASPEKSLKLLGDLHPWQSLALLHAAIAGVYLFLAGLVSGYFDNFGVYRNIPERVRRLPWLHRRIGARRAGALADYLSHNLGGIAGNIAFGFMMGLTGFVGFILGLPLDIRHVTFAAANFSIGLEALDGPYDHAWLWTLAAGIALVGLVNLLVSFTLALVVALKARRVPFRYVTSLVAPLFVRLRRKPLDFIRPPREDNDFRPNAPGDPAP